MFHRSHLESLSLSNLSYTHDQDQMSIPTDTTLPKLSVPGMQPGREKEIALPAVVFTLVGPYSSRLVVRS
eukprot:3885192-Amphidinium_carterae.1